MKPIAFTFFALLAFLGWRGHAADGGKPNILLIFADEVG